MKKKLSEDIRQTYILLYEKDDVKYIFNRSIKWDSIMSTKNIQGLISVLGREAITNFIIRMNENIKKTSEDINSFTNTFIYDDTIFKILEIHPEWENYKRENQKSINERKLELCKEYNAVNRKDEIADGYGLDIQIAKIIKNEFKKWLVDIYSEISKYSHLIYDETVKTTLYLTKESLLEDIKTLGKQVEKLEEQINDNKIKLKRQNFVISNYYKGIKKLNPDKFEKIKSMIAYGKYCE